MHPEGDIPAGGLDWRFSRYPTDRFLVEVIPRESLRFLTRLDIALPLLLLGYIYPGEEALSGWNSAVMLLKQNLHHQLFIRIFLARHGLFYGRTVKESTNLKENYRNFCKPLKQLGLHNFRVCLLSVYRYSWPYIHWHPDRENMQVFIKQENAFARHLEKLVLGDKFDLEVQRQQDTENNPTVLDAFEESSSSFFR
jgi:hypothetical protein